MSSHAPIAPSALERIVPCPGSVALSRPFEDKETEASKEGQVAHKVAMMWAMWAQHTAARPPPVQGETIDGVRVDKEMVEGAKLYAEALEGFAGHPEQTIAIKRIHEHACWGTPDFWQYAANTKTLRITDYKYGHRYVEVYENYQLMAYAAGIIDMLVEQQTLHEFETVVEFMLVQPRCYSADSPVRTWTTSATNLRAYMNEAANAAEDALSPNPRTKAGTHCLFCPARAVCKTAHVASTAILEYAGRVEAMAQNGAEVGLRLNLVNAALDMLKAVSTGLEEQAIAMLRAGKNVPYFMIDYTKPRETWSKPVAAVKMLGLVSGKVLTEETYAVTPKQAVKLGIDRAVISSYSFTPNGSAKLVHCDLTDAAKIFQK